ncbi:hypothetical protein SNE40_006980 [Patella caerulea]|uniref:CWH43-like N-terminal domain-containing protein n=1 Tax=Patella caerulea TaxID=87958 RepID=A0AAN8K501_PATCE
MVTYRGHFILIALTILFPLTCIISYTMAVLLGHVNAWFPYISDTGTRPPESCVFGFLLGIYALICAKAIHLRYRQVSIYYTDSNRNILLITNKVALFIGWSAALGIYLVANFQETNVLAVHLIGAFLAFMIGCVYMWVQTVISYRTSLLPGHSHNYTRLRLFLTVLNSLGIIVFLVFATIASSKKPKDDQHWGPGSDGFTEHVVSTLLEWVVAFIATGYFLTFAKEFHKFELQEAKLNFLESGSNFELGGKSTEETPPVTINGIENY